MNELPAWQAAKNILCIRLDSMGDVLMTSPAIRAIKESIAGSRITLLASPSGARAAPLIPEIDEVMIFDAPWMKAAALRSQRQVDFEMIERLRRSGFDGAVIFTVFSQNPLPAAYLCLLAEIPLRLAYCRENPYQLLTNWVKETEPDLTIRHEVQRQLDLAGQIGCRTEYTNIQISVHAADQLSVKKKLAEAGVNLDRPWIVIHPGATAPSRRYEPEGFAQAAEVLSELEGWQVVLSGDASELNLVAGIKEHARRTFSLAGKLSLGEMAALIQGADLLISNNSGPVHIAAGVGTPVVDLYALTNPQHTPWQVPNRVLNQDVPCKYCYKSVCPMQHHHCLTLVTPEQVVQAANDLLKESHTLTKKIIQS
jgi:lipopolysaccharide heptosyltransferase II